jgi:hypothetical protein
MLRTSLLAVPLLVVGLLAGCGDDGGDGGGGAADAPKNATVEEFCQPFVDMYQDVVAKGEDIADEDAVRIARDTADKSREAGTPEDVPEDARKGWELVIEKLSELDEDATTEEVQAAQNLSEEEQKYSDALARYVASKCADAMAGAMGGAS